MSQFVELFSGNFENTRCDHEISVISEVYALKPEIIENRRWFHAHPELSFQEFNTAAKVAELLRSYGIEEVFEQIGNTGVVALIRGKSDSPCIALRADMDALPLTETSDIPFVSQNAGVMHACGHDGHMSGLLAAAKVLFNERENLNGTVKLIFQPAEEGYGGAREMIKDGVLEAGRLGPNVDSIFGIHLWSYYPLGTVGAEEGPIMASSDKFTIQVKGVGGHGGVPQGTVDSIVEAAHLITALQTVVSRNKDPLQSGVLSLGTIHGGESYNAITDLVTITGTTRSFSPKIQELIVERMRNICCGIGSTFGGQIDLDYSYGYPITVNAYPDCVLSARNVAERIVGKGNANGKQMTMGAEDFSYFLQERPGCFIFVGAGLPGDIRAHHKSVFDFDENAILVSASIFVELVRDILNE